MYHASFTQPFQAAKERRARYPFFFEIGPFTLGLVAILTLSLPSLLYATQIGRVAATGYDVRRLEAQRDALRREREQLLLRTAELQNFDRIEHEARRLGMVPASAPEFAPGAGAAAAAPTATPPPRREQAPWEVPFSAAWWQRYLPALRPRTGRETVAQAGSGPAVAESTPVLPTPI